MSDKPRTSKDSSGVVVEGIDNCLIKMARCCSPIPGEEIVGFINHKPHTIHRKDCVNVPDDLKNCPEPDCGLIVIGTTMLKLTLVQQSTFMLADRDGVVLDITACMATAHVKIRSINAVLSARAIVLRL